MAQLRPSLVSTAPAPNEMDAKKAALLDPMRRQLANWQSPQALAAEKFTPRNTITDAPLKQFESVRQGVMARGNTAKQGNLEAMQRRFAAMGGLNSGAAIKSQQVAAEEADRATADQLAGVDTQETNERQRRLENEQNQNNAREEAMLGRNFQREMTNQSMAFQDRISKFDAGSKLAQLDLGFEQFGLSKDESEFNKAVARDKAKHSGGLFGGGGFLGLGLNDSEVNF